jgi:hypothetical protein
MYLGSWKIDDYLTFPVNTHTPATGAATDADAVPTYRVYEDDTGTPIENGSLAKLDDANTTGFYVLRIQLDAATGYEAGKSYTIYVSATVGSIVGTLSHTFQMQAQVALHADWINGGRLDLLIDAIITHLTEIKGATFSGASDSLEEIRDRGDAAWITGGASGSGAIEWEYTLTSTAGGDPISDADVWVTTDIAGANVIASGKTDSFGNVTFWLDAGTYYIWRQKAGFNFDNPDVETVS